MLSCAFINSDQKCWFADALYSFAIDVPLYLGDGHILFMA